MSYEAPRKDIQSSVKPKELSNEQRDFLVFLFEISKVALTARCAFCPLFPFEAQKTRDICHRK